MEGSPGPVPSSVEDRLHALGQLVGRTPLLRLPVRFRGLRITVWAKHEMANPTGSIKDRMALHILRTAYRAGAIQPGDVIAEATSGNTGISFAALGRALGHPVRIYMPDWMSVERVQVIRSLGAEVVPVSAGQGGFLGSISLAREYAADTGNVFLPQQFDNAANVEAHSTGTGPEILAQMRARGAEPGAFVAGVGTGGTVMGVGQYLKAELPEVRVHPLEPANSPTMRTGCKVGKHRIQGISDEFIPSIVDLGALDEILDVWDGDAIRMAQRLAQELGLAVGISSGANFLGALLAAERLGDGAQVATVFPDCNKKYLSTDYCREEEPREGYFADEAELDGFDVVPWRCERCETAPAGAAAAAAEI
ncbi:MAG: cysteine synthase family protein [Planctomycetota bacterium]|nr:MAG: cysteine synthase family protein [Planctomycetota bacterium]